MRLEISTQVLQKISGLRLRFSPLFTHFNLPPAPPRDVTAAMAEQLILKGTLEGHVCRILLTSLPRYYQHAYLHVKTQLTHDTEWLGHQLGHFDGEV